MIHGTRPSTVAVPPERVRGRIPYFGPAALTQRPESQNTNTARTPASSDAALQSFYEINDPSPFRVDCKLLHCHVISNNSANRSRIIVNQYILHSF